MGDLDYAFTRRFLHHTISTGERCLCVGVSAAHGSFVWRWCASASPPHFKVERFFLEHPKNPALKKHPPRMSLERSSIGDSRELVEKNLSNKGNLLFVMTKFPNEIRLKNMICSWIR